MTLLPLILGSVVGFSLGLTGGGGAIFAVPLLIYGLGVPTRDATGISMITVGATALMGFLQRASRRQVEFPTGFLFAAAGMIGAPIGSWLSGRIPDHVLLGVFSLLMLVISIRMWVQAGSNINEHSLHVSDGDGPTCNRDPEGKLRITSDCALLLAIVGMAAGILTGLFGVGGGFIIVPALVIFSGMGMQQAIGMSLLVISLVSISGVASHLLAGRHLEMMTAVIFSFGSVAGLYSGSRLSRRFSGRLLQRVFAAAIVAVAVYVVVRSQ